jgi:hypothetical protein
VIWILKSLPYFCWKGLFLHESFERPIHLSSGTCLSPFLLRPLLFIYILYYFHHFFFVILYLFHAFFLFVPLFLSFVFYSRLSSFFSAFCTFPFLSILSYRVSLSLLMFYSYFRSLTSNMAVPYSSISRHIGYPYRDLS